MPAELDLVSLIDMKMLIAADHPLRVIKRMLDEVLRRMREHFDEIYATTGALSAGRS